MTTRCSRRHATSPSMASVAGRWWPILRGEVLAEAGSGEAVLHVRLDLDAIDRERARKSALRMRRPHLYDVRRRRRPEPSRATAAVAADAVDAIGMSQLEFAG